MRHRLAVGAEWGEVWLSRSDVDCGEVGSRRIRLEAGITVEVNLNWVTHYLAYFCNSKTCSVGLLGVAMAE